MELLEWLHLLNALDLNQSQTSLSVANSLFFLYVVLSVLIKRATYLVAFFICVLLIDNKELLILSEYQAYLLMCVIYSYIFEICLTSKSKGCCVIIISITITFATDAFLYGENGYYGASHTLIYNNIEHIALCAHILFICSLVPIERIRNSLRSFIDYVDRVSANSDYMFIYWYNVGKIQQTNNLR